jgi:hypothetical protein
MKIWFPKKFICRIWRDPIIEAIIEISLLSIWMVSLFVIIFAWPTKIVWWIGCTTLVIVVKAISAAYKHIILLIKSSQKLREMIAFERILARQLVLRLEELRNIERD